MPLESTLVIDDLFARLISEPTLLGSFDPTDGYAGLATGGIYTQPIKRDGNGQTPRAFYTTSKAGKAIRPCIVLLDRGERPHVQRPWIPGAYVQSIWVYFYALATAQGKQQVGAMRQLVYELLDHQFSGWVFGTDDQPKRFCTLVDRFGIHDSETFPEAVEDYQRYEVTSRYDNN